MRTNFHWLLLDDGNLVMGCRREGASWAVMDGLGNVSCVSSRRILESRCLSAPEVQVSYEETPTHSLAKRHAKPGFSR